MSHNHKRYPKIPYDTVCKAVQGDSIAIQKILCHYRAYMMRLSTYSVFDQDGKETNAFDKEVFDELEIALITGILKFKIA